MPDLSPRTVQVLRSVGVAFALSLIPVLACVVAMVIGFRRRDGEYMPASVFVEGIPFLLAAVAVPSALPIGVATGRRTRLGMVAAMTAVAAIAGTVNAAANDSQAGLALVWVVTIAVPLAAVVAAAQLLRSVSQRKVME